MDKPALEALLGSLDGWAAFFTLLVVAGVGGEFAVHIMSSRASKRLVDIQRQEEQARQAEIARITKDAESFRAESAKAQSDIAATSVRISDAEARVAEATARAAEANKKAEEERLERVKIQEKLAPRHLSAEQRQGIAVRLRPFAGTKINVFAYGGDQEIVGIGNVLLAVLERGAGWAPSVFHGQEMGRAVSGLLVEVKPGADGRTQAAAMALVAALASERLAVEGPVPFGQGGATMGTGNMDPDAKIVMTIGRKP